MVQEDGLGGMVEHWLVKTSEEMEKEEKKRNERDEKIITKAKIDNSICVSTHKCHTT